MFKLLGKESDDWQLLAWPCWPKRRQQVVAIFCLCFKKYSTNYLLTSATNPYYILLRWQYLTTDVIILSDNKKKSLRYLLSTNNSYIIIVHVEHGRSCATYVELLHTFEWLTFQLCFLFTFTWAVPYFYCKKRFFFLNSYIIEERHSDAIVE